MSFAPDAPAVLPSDEGGQSIFEASPSATAVTVAARTGPIIVSANAAFLKLMGLQRPAAEGRRLETVFRGAAGSQVRKGFEQCLIDGAAVRLRVVRAPRGEMERLEVEMRGTQFAGHPAVVLCVRAVDRPAALADLGEAGVLAEIGALSRGLVYIRNAKNGVWRHSGHPLAAVLGFASGDQEGGAMDNFLFPEDLERFRAFRAHLVAGPDDDVSKGVFRLRDKDGACRWIEFRSRVFTRDEEGAVERTIGVLTDVTQSYLQAQAMAEAADNLAHAEVNERRRIGRELHDSTSQLLVAARLGLAALERRAPMSADQRAAVEEVRQSIARAQHEIRSFTYLLHPPALARDGLAACLKTFGAGFSQRTGLKVTVKVARNVGAFSTPMELALYRIAQEALMNVYRHARAGAAQVRLKRCDSQVILEIEDDGIGLSLPPGSLGGVGISGMHARMTQLGGVLELLPGAIGLLVRATAPGKPPLRPRRIPVS